MFPIDIDFSRLKRCFTYDPQAPMIFSSGIFLWLFAAFMIVYTLLQRKLYGPYSVCDAFLLLLLL